MKKGVISYFLKYITNFLEGKNVPSPLCISQVAQISVSHSGSQLELIDSVMLSCLPLLFHLLFTSVWWSKSACVPLQCFFGEYLFLFISSILILLQATIIPSSELLKQSDTVSLLQGLGFEFDFIHLSPVSLCFISAMCYRVHYYPPYCSLALWVRLTHVWYRVNICWISISGAISCCFSGLQVGTWEFHI